MGSLRQDRCNTIKLPLAPMIDATCNQGGIQPQAQKRGSGNEPPDLLIPPVCNRGNKIPIRERLALAYTLRTDSTSNRALWLSGTAADLKSVPGINATDSKSVVSPGCRFDSYQRRNHYFPNRFFNNICCDVFSGGGSRVVGTKFCTCMQRATRGLSFPSVKSTEKVVDLQGPFTWPTSLWVPPRPTRDWSSHEGRLRKTRALTIN